jgi:DNA-binding response OmpR family regulator
MRVLLVIEDDRDSNDAIVSVLTNAGYRCLAALNAEQGLLLMQKHEPSLVVLDLYLPGMSGAEFLVRKAAIDAVAAIPVVVITGLSDVPRLDNVVAALRKPFTIDEIVELVRKFAPLPRPEPKPKTALGPDLVAPAPRST